MLGMFWPDILLGSDPTWILPIYQQPKGPWIYTLTVTLTTVANINLEHIRCQIRTFPCFSSFMKCELSTSHFMGKRTEK